MFKHLFNTYETVEPPPKFKRDIYKEIHLKPEEDTITNLFDPLLIDSTSSAVPNVEKPSEESFIINNNESTMSESGEDENERYQYLISDTNNLLINNVINTGRSLVGGKYVSGGTSPLTGFDCSGFIQYIFKLNGISIPRDTNGIFKIGKEVLYSDIRPGDIICSKGSGITGKHVAVVSRIDPSTNLIYVMEAKGRKWGVVEGPLTKSPSKIITIRRIIAQNNPLKSLNNTSFLLNYNVKAPSKLIFDSLAQFALVMTSKYQQALKRKGYDPRFATMIVALDANESGWGQKLSGNYNYGGITTLGSDWHKRTGLRKWKDFTSIDHYIDWKIDYLLRKYKMFTTFSPLDGVAKVMLYIANKGYDPGNPLYGIYVANTYNTVLKKLNSRPLTATRIDTVFKPTSSLKNSSLLYIDIEDLLRLEKITSINGKPIKFGNKGLRSANATFGSKYSNHKKKDPYTGNAMARDISIVGGTYQDYADFRARLLSNSRVVLYMAVRGWGIINELTPQALKKYRGTGPHFHFGPDTCAKRTWLTWLNNPNVPVTKLF